MKLCYNITWVHNSKKQKLTIWPVDGRVRSHNVTMINSEKSEKPVAQSIVEFSAPVQNDSSRVTISSEHQVELIGNSGGLFVRNRDHFCPFTEVILDAKNVLVPSVFIHLHQIYGNLIPHFLRDFSTFNRFSEY